MVRFIRTSVLEWRSHSRRVTSHCAGAGPRNAALTAIGMASEAVLRSAAWRGGAARPAVPTRARPPAFPPCVPLSLSLGPRCTPAAPRLAAQPVKPLPRPVTADVVLATARLAAAEGLAHASLAEAYAARAGPKTQTAVFVLSGRGLAACGRRVASSPVCHRVSKLRVGNLWAGAHAALGWK